MSDQAQPQTVTPEQRTAMLIELAKKLMQPQQPVLTPGQGAPAPRG